METNQNTNTQKTTPVANIGNKLIITSVVALLAGVAIGYGFSFFMNSEPDTNEQHELLKQAVRDQYPEYFGQEDFETFYSGTVQEVKESSIVIKMDIPEIVLLASDLKETREIKIDNNTRIIKEVQKDSEQYNRELAQYETAYAEYEQQINNLPGEEAIDATEIEAEPLFPSITEEKDISVGEIKIGEQVSVSVEGGEILAGEEDVLDEVNRAPDMTTIIRVQEGFADDTLLEDTETIEGEITPEEGFIEPEGAEPTTP